jgi:hypothetical protein
MVTEGEHEAIKVTITRKIMMFFIVGNFGLKLKPS